MGLHEIIKRIQGQVSYAQHKIEKTIILEEKAEREQAKKEKELFKRLEEKIYSETMSKIKGGKNLNINNSNIGGLQGSNNCISKGFIGSSNGLNSSNAFGPIN